MPGSTRRLVKSRSNGRLREAASAFIAAHQETILIAPTHSAGEDLVHRTNGLAGVHRMTLIQVARDLAWPSMAELNLAPVTALGAEALAARAVYHARAARELKYFEPVADLPGFARALTRTLTELRLAGIDCEALSRGEALERSGIHPANGGADRIAESGGDPRADLARLLARYQAELEARSLADLARVLELASKAAESDRHRWLGLPVVLLDAPLESRAHREFFRSFAARAPSVLAAIGPDSESGCDAKHASRCDSIAKALGTIGKDPVGEDLDATTSLAAPMEHLRKYLFEENTPAPDTDDSCLEIFSAPGEGLEAAEIARRILRIAREGVPFDQMAILLRSPERYQPLIEDALHRARIPAYFSKGSARPDPGGRAFLALLKCAAEKCSASLFSEYLSLGQVPQSGKGSEADGDRRTEWIPAGDELLPNPNVPEDTLLDAATADTDETQVVRAPAAWEKLLVDAAVIGGRERWQRRLQGLEREFELRLTMLERDDQPARDAVDRKLTQLRGLKEFALPLIALLDALPHQAHWKEWIERLGELARAALRRPEPVLAMLAEFEPMGDVGPAMLEEVAEVLSDRLRFLRSEPPERRYGHVFIASIDESRGREFGIVFLPGLAEGIFPQRAFEDPLLLDQSRRDIRDLVSDDSLLLRDDRVDQERARLKVSAAAARDRLIASYPRMDVAEARPRVPSFYALELTRAAAGKLPELKGFERRAAEASPARLNWPAPADAGDAIDDIEYDLVALRRALDNPAASLGSARYLVEANDRLARSLRARYKRWDMPKWTEADGLITHNAQTLAALAEHRLSARAWSPTSLQHFAACPYRFALHGIYGLRPRDDASPIEQMDPLTRGGLFHAVQFALLNNLKDRAMLPVNPQSLAETLVIADAVLDETAAKYEEELAPAIPRVWKTEIEDLRTDLRGWLQHVAVNDSDWEPIHFEFAFGLARPASGTDKNGPLAAGAGNASHDPASSPGEAELADSGVRLRGSIDLVERHTETRALRITDHKTGKPPSSIPLYVGGGRLLQPLLYGLAAGQLLGGTVESGRLFYATQQGGYQHALIPIHEKSRAFLTKLLSNIDGAIAAGFLPPHPQKDGCDFCDYRVVCGPYEELRTARHKDRRDDRLDPLIEIRAMA
jgi:ATP-dependent helicase/nuclease subunit B